MTTLTKQHKAAINGIVDSHEYDNTSDYKRMESAVELILGVKPDYDTTWSLCRRSEKLCKDRKAGRTPTKPKISFSLNDLV
jgi:hypothetical protein